MSTIVKVTAWLLPWCDHSLHVFKVTWARHGQDWSPYHQFCLQALSSKLIGDSFLSFPRPKHPASIFRPSLISQHILVALVSDSIQLPTFLPAPQLLKWLLNLSPSSPCDWPTFLRGVYFTLKYQTQVLLKHVRFYTSQCRTCLAPPCLGLFLSSAPTLLPQACILSHVLPGHCHFSYEHGLLFFQSLVLS